MQFVLSHQHDICLLEKERVRIKPLKNLYGQSLGRVHFVYPFNNLGVGDFSFRVRVKVASRK